MGRTGERHRLLAVERSIEARVEGGTLLRSSVISFVIPAHNESAFIAPTLASIQSASAALGERCEIIVAADACVDDTAAIASRAGAKVIEIDVRQIGAARNAGAAVAQEELLVFVDADTLVNEPLIRATAAAVRDGAVGGGCLVRFDTLNRRSARLLEWVAARLYRMTGLAAGCYLFAQREAFEAAGGFDERYFASEELWMSLALRRQGRFVLLHEHVVTSGRKIEHLSALQIVSLLGSMAIKGPRGMQQREGLDIWYKDQRVTRGEHRSP